MKAVILAGGLGTRLAEETNKIPKPMVEIGGMPILWHIMKIFSSHGVNDFVVCLGYKGDVIKDFFYNYTLMSSDLKINLQSKEIRPLTSNIEPWNITLIDSGLETMTGGRLAYIKNYLNDDEPFFMTYGDGLGDIDLTSLLKFHLNHGKKATVTAVTPPGRFGVLDVVGDVVLGFREKIVSEDYKINAGYFVLEKCALDYIAGPNTIWEEEPMTMLSQNGELRAWKHDGFWMPMDTLREKQILQKKWDEGNAPWKMW